jgi:hypothetical protein
MQVVTEFHFNFLTDTQLRQPWARTTDIGESTGPAEKSVPVPIGLAGLNRRTIDAGRNIEMQKKPVPFGLAILNMRTIGAGRNIGMQKNRIRLGSQY